MHSGRRKIAARKTPVSRRTGRALFRCAHGRVCNQGPGEGEGFRPDLDVDPRDLPADIRWDLRRIRPFGARQEVPSAQFLREDGLARPVLPLHKDGADEEKLADLLRAELPVSLTVARSIVETGDDTVFIPWLHAALPPLKARLEAASRSATVEADRMHFADMALHVG